MRIPPNAFAIGALAASLALATPATASPVIPAVDLLATVEEPPPEADPDFNPGVLPALVGLVPGVALHGAGHFAAGDTDTALTLLGLQGLGVGMILAGGAPLAVTGASRRIVGPITAVSLMGVGLLFVPMLPDVYGALTGGRDAPPPMRLPLTVRLGYSWVYDPQFTYRHFTTLGYAARFDAISLVGDAWLAVDDDNQRLRQRLDWRIVGDNVGAPDAGGALDLQTAITWHNYGTEGFSRLSGEIAFDGVYDLARLSPTLSGSFALAALGWSLEIYDYDVPGLDFGEDTHEQLLARFGWGIWFSERRGALSVYYDHRKDDHAGGLSTSGLGGGIPGYLGLDAWHAIDEAWAVDLDVRFGSAWIVGAGLRYRYDGE